ncbi:sulfate adenylyltransferase subunit CysN [Terrarubrum flagellatum]|uniref:sulfate adenylyltransferase subunit CysN n=1 Tax=Terrirubrum flagellatum TaxID=2895980 RepID=UPI003144DEFD
MSARAATKVEQVAREQIPAAANAPTALAPAVAGPTLLRFITCGSVDDGKSTLIGRLMVEAGVVPDDQLAALESDSAKQGSAAGELDYSLLVDGLAAEREQGITIDVAYRYFATAKRAFIVADTPGHEQYTRNMATGASTADLAVILIDARKGVLPQTRRHSFIVSLMGVRRVVLAINKMDMVGYDESVFARIDADYRAAVASLGFEQIAAVPVSAREGDNIAARSERTPWFTGAPLLALLEGAQTDARAADEAGFAFPVQWVNRPNLDFRGYAGTVARGAVSVGAEVVALPSGRRSRIARIVTADGDLDAAQIGQAVTVTLDDEIDISRGDVLASPTLRPRIRKHLSARLLWTGERPMRGDRDYLIRVGAATARASIEAVHSVIDVESFAAKPAETLAMNDIGLASLAFDRPLVVTDFAESAELGGFILIDRLTNETVAFGFVAPDGSDPAASARSEELARLVSKHLGRPGTDTRLRRMQEVSWRIVSAVIVGALTLWATDSAILAWTLAGADLVLRTALRRINALAWRRALKRRPVHEFNDYGGGI